MRIRITPVGLIMLLVLCFISFAAAVEYSEALRVRAWVSETGARWESNEPDHWRTLVPAGSDVAYAYVIADGPKIRIRMVRKCFGDDATVHESSLEWTFGESIGTRRACDGTVEKTGAMLRFTEHMLEPYPPEIEASIALYRNMRKT